MLNHKSGTVSGVAAVYMATRTERHAASYREQVTTALTVHLNAKRVPKGQHSSQIASFWAAVDQEIARRSMKEAR